MSDHTLGETFKGLKQILEFISSHHSLLDWIVLLPPTPSSLHQISRPPEFDRVLNIALPSVIWQQQMSKQ